MNSRFSGSSMVAVLAVASLAVSGYLHARTTSAPAPVKPTAVAVVNLDGILGGLKEATDREAALGAIWKERDAKIKEAVKKVNDLTNEITVMKPDNPDYGKKQAERAMATGVAAGMEQGLKQLQSLEAAQDMARLYQKINAKLAAMSARDGWSLVLLDDRFLLSQLEKAKSTQEVGSLMRDIRVLHAAAEVDITQQVIGEMNAEYAAPGKKN